MTNHDVVVYVSSNCKQCEQVLSLLDDWGVTYQEINTSKDRDYMKELQKNNIYGTPATFIGNEIVLGLQKNKLKRELGLEANKTFLYTSSFNR
ncbi:glutaredoxin family protein [Aquibacillus halophilus]|uniref:Glutaredoxin family protein n=1 Tax=Aquibacillus halophilus TaxID=930132 RepID=A0A6A8DEG7_9BACI|nr:glutaredoxin family protein [Aquibacillus halophilus]MRH43640.1 glutaredoxin family protein [Aquibacillus halophilus]